MFRAVNTRLCCWLLQKILGYFQSHFFSKGNVRTKGWHGRCWEVARDLESASASAASFLYEPHWVIPFSVSLREIRADAVVGSKILRRHCLQVSFHRSGPSRCGWWERGNRQASNPVRLRFTAAASYGPSPVWSVGLDYCSHFECQTFLFINPGVRSGPGHLFGCHRRNCWKHLLSEWNPQPRPMSGNCSRENGTSIQCSQKPHRDDIAVHAPHPSFRADVLPQKNEPVYPIRAIRKINNYP